HRFPWYMRPIAIDTLTGVSLLTVDALAALVTAGTRPRRSLGVILGVGALALPWVATGTAVRGLLAIYQLIPLIRVIDLFRETSDRGWKQRLWHVGSIVDTRTLRRSPRKLDRAALTTFLVSLAAAAAGLGLAWRYGAYGADPARLAARWIGGVL